MLHVDIKKLGRIGRGGRRITGDRRWRVRGIGWEYVHVYSDDCSRLGYAERRAGRHRRGVSPLCRGLVRATRHHRRTDADRQPLGLSLPRRRAACRALALAQRFTRPYTPRTNGKAERFIQILLREWAYPVAHPSSAHRTATLDRWLHYNWHRALGYHPERARNNAFDYVI